MGNARIGSSAFPFVIVAINILIAVVSDFESAVRAFGTTWVSTEGVTLYGGWHNVFNGIAGLLNIACHDRLVRHLYRPRSSQDMLWPDMTWVFIIAYDHLELLLHLQLPAHPFLVLRHRPAARADHRRHASGTRAAGFRTAPSRFAIWCMFCQMVPMFVNDSVFAVQSVNNPDVNLGVSIVLALAANIAAAGLHRLPRQEARREPVQAGSVRRNQGLPEGHGAPRRHRLPA